MSWCAFSLTYIVFVLFCMNLMSCSWCKMAECFCHTRCSHHTGISRRPCWCWGHWIHPAGQLSSPLLSSLFVPDSLQWCHSVGRSRGCKSAYVLFRRLGVTALLLSCLKNWKCLNYSLSDIMVVLKRFTYAAYLQYGCCSNNIDPVAL